VLLGSVPDLYTTGDNDPEIEPRSYYRHYLYCDACGSFELAPWMKPDNHGQLERWRGWLGTAALWAMPFLLVVVWTALGLQPSAGLVWLVAVIVVINLVLWGTVFRWTLFGTWAGVDQPWRLLAAALPWLAVGGLAVWFAANPGGSPSALLAVSAIIVAGLLAWRAWLSSKIEHIGRRCAQCGATYAYGTPFFTDLDANPRGLTVKDVPRPLGSSPFEIGKSVAYEPPKTPGPLGPPGRLPE
jgi:hypothetical protein